MQSNHMENNWAEENLQTIRTLMERSALYRRALAPIMLLAGALGVVAAVIGLTSHFDSTRAFDLLWLSTAVVAVIGAFLIARQQALKDREPFWSPPTRRVAQALIPPLLAGMVIGIFPAFFQEAEKDLNFCSAIVWIMFYGCALHAAGFFMPRGVKVFGWLLIASACGVLYAFALGDLNTGFSAHLLMGFFFGALHLAYGIYLYLTEKGKNAA